jgi:long-chain acyl-CoA synthetase
MGDQIKSAGMNITPREVELVLEGLPEVAMAIVTGIPAGERGEDVVAAVVLKPGAAAGEDGLRSAVKAEIASYKVPRHIAVFGDQSELPWLDSGKIDRRRVTAILDERFGVH